MITDKNSIQIIKRAACQAFSRLIPRWNISLSLQSIRLHKNSNTLNFFFIVSYIIEPESWKKWGNPLIKLKKYTALTLCALTLTTTPLSALADEYDQKIADQDKKISDLQQTE